MAVVETVLVLTVVLVAVVRAVEAVLVGADNLVGAMMVEVDEAVACMVAAKAPAALGLVVVEGEEVEWVAEVRLAVGVGVDSDQVKVVEAREVVPVVLVAVVKVTMEHVVVVVATALED